MMLICVALLIGVFCSPSSCGADDSEIGCNAECVGPDAAVCGSLRDGSFSLNSPVNMEIYFWDTTTLIEVRVVFAADSTARCNFSIGLTETDTSSETYDGSASYTEVSSSYFYGT